MYRNYRSASPENGMRQCRPSKGEEERIRERAGVDLDKAERERYWQRLAWTAVPRVLDERGKARR